VANALLLIGDFATGTSAMPFVAAVVAIGYLMLVVWFALIAVKLLRFSTNADSSNRPTLWSPLAHS
jgi:hypothetical protein